MITREDLMSFNLHYSGTNWKESDILEWFSVLGAGWVHNGDPNKPHALLHSGRHSDGFFLCKKVLKFGNLREILAAMIAYQIRQKVFSKKINGVFGAPYSSITLAADVARLLGVPNYIPEKDPVDPKKMVFKPDDPIPEGASLLQVEELITTFDSAQLAKDAIVAGNPNKVEFIPFIGSVIHRPSKMCDEYDGRKLIAIVNRQVSAWEAVDCPLCKQGSVALPPKTNWAELIA